MTHPSRWLARVFVLVFASASMCARVLAADAPIAADFPTLPNDSWYRVEIVLFERIAEIDATASRETLFKTAPQQFPLDMFAFDDDASRAAAYPLDAATRALPVLTGVVADLPSPTPAAPAGEPTPAQRAAEAIDQYEKQLQERSYRPEPSSAYLLAAEDGRLQRSGAYRVLLHRAWIQPVPDRDRLQPMLIQVGDRNGWQIEGYLGVTRGRYLHMDTRLWYTPIAATVASGSPSPTALGGDSGATPPYLELSEQRRMRSGELHYLDHPKFGVLARVDPVEPPDALLAELQRLAELQGAAPQR